MMVSPSSPQPVVVAVLSKVRGLYETLSVPMLRYRLVLVDWMEPAMLKYSDVAAGPRTTREPVKLVRAI
jgi:hypothetical protein